METIKFKMNCTKLRRRKILDKVGPCLLGGSVAVYALSYCTHLSYFYASALLGISIILSIFGLWYNVRLGKECMNTKSGFNCITYYPFIDSTVGIGSNYKSLCILNCNIVESSNPSFDITYYDIEEIDASLVFNQISGFEEKGLPTYSTKVVGGLVGGAIGATIAGQIAKGSKERVTIEGVNEIYLRISLKNNPHKCIDCQIYRGGILSREAVEKGSYSHSVKAHRICNIVNKTKKSVVEE